MRSMWEVQAEARGKTPAERFRLARSHLEKCRERYSAAQSDLIEAERFAAEAGNEYMREYFPPDRK